MDNCINRSAMTLICIILTSSIWSQEIYLRGNQLGYHPQAEKKLIVLSKVPVNDRVKIKSADGETLDVKIYLNEIMRGKWGQFRFQYELDISEIKKEGSYHIDYGHKSFQINVLGEIYEPHLSTLLSFMRQQRCGYNPYFDVVCHQGDGRIFYAPVPDSSYYDFTGGWHDAGDQLKYLITGSNATARMLMAYETAPEKFADSVDALGHPHPNGIPDILDETKWGLDWILKLHPRKDWLIHQIADDRDHRGFKLPHLDNAEYGWGKNSYRVAYFANGQPQGLNKYKSKATGIANLAGRCAAALAMGSKIFEEIDQPFALRCRQASEELYQMGKNHEGFQQGNSFGAPYRYNEDSWADDMEWGATELFKITGKEDYLTDAIHYANLIKEDGWMARDTMLHYQKYPFMNMGHYSLYDVAPEEIKKKILHWYKSNIEKVVARAETNAYKVGTTFIWCSNNLTVNFITQLILYEKMSGDQSFHHYIDSHRDWVLGRNPWGTSMFTGIPERGEYPEDAHLASTYILGETPAGGLVDGPLYVTTYRALLGLVLNDPDEFAPFQNEVVTYHDDIGDYSTNEPTMDGTADAILMWALLGK